MCVCWLIETEPLITLIGFKVWGGDDTGYCALLS